MYKNLILLNAICIVLSSKCHDKNIGTFVHFSDIHYDYSYKVNTPTNCYFHSLGLPCCKSYNWKTPYNLSGKWGDNNCNTPFILMNETLNYISNFNSDFYIYTGDSTDHQIPFQTPNSIKKEMITVYDLFRIYFPKMYHTVGNHDTWPVNQIPGLFIDINNFIFNLWKPWVTNESYSTVKQGLFYKQTVAKNLDIISINTARYESGNYLQYLFSYDTTQLNWLKKEVSISKKNNKKVWLIYHVFPDKSGTNKYFNNFMTNLTIEYKDTIKYQFAGHKHNDRFLLYEKNNTYYGPVLIPNSFMPDRHDSCFRKYIYNKNTFEIYDYIQYCIDLKETNKKNKLIVYEKYSFVDEYGVNFNLEGLTKLYQRLKNKTTLEKYCDNYSPNYKIDCNQELIDEIIIP